MTPLSHRRQAVNQAQQQKLEREMRPTIEEAAKLLIAAIGDTDIIDQLGLVDDTAEEWAKSELSVKIALLELVRVRLISG
jgi:hypothetical protein